MVLLTNCEVHTEKYSDRSFEVRIERSEVRTKAEIRVNEKLKIYPGAGTLFRVLSCKPGFLQSF